MQDAEIPDLHDELLEISKELYFIANELVETNQRLHVLVAQLSSQKRLQSKKKPPSQSSEE